MGQSLLHNKEHRRQDRQRYAELAAGLRFRTRLQNLGSRRAVCLRRSDERRQRDSKFGPACAAETVLRDAFLRGLRTVRDGKGTDAFSTGAGDGARAGQTFCRRQGTGGKTASATG